MTNLSYNRNTEKITLKLSATITINSIFANSFLKLFRCIN